MPGREDFTYNNPDIDPDPIGTQEARTWLQDNYPDVSLDLFERLRAPLKDGHLVVFDSSAPYSSPEERPSIEEAIHRVVAREFGEQ